MPTARDSSLHEKQIALDGAVQNLSNSVQSIVSMQQSQTTQMAALMSASRENSVSIKTAHDNIIQLSNDIREQGSNLAKLTTLVTTATAQQGSFRLQQILPVLIPLVAFITAIAAMYIAPIRQQLDSQKETMVAHMSQPGHADSMIWRSAYEAKMTVMEKELERRGVLLSAIETENKLRDKERNLLVSQEDVLKQQITEFKAALALLNATDTQSVKDRSALDARMSVMEKMVENNDGAKARAKP